MSKQHTPGPWARFCPDPEDDTEFAVQKLEGQFPRLDSYVQICGGIRQKGGEADARLIAAAPELLESLVEMVEAAEESGQKDRPMVVSARERITKARS